MKKAVTLLSGGLDSATVLAIAKADGFDCYAISFDYQQRGVITELNSARQVCEALGVGEHKIFTVNTGQFGGSALTDTNITVPIEELTSESKEIPVTYVPARNTVFLSIALGWAEVIGAYDIFIGANIIDYSNYPDCRAEYLEAFEKLANLATKTGTEGQNFKIHAPLLYLSKSEIIQRGLALNLDYQITTSCYQPDTNGHACGKCESCQIRAQAFKKLNVLDPTPYIA